MIRHSNSLFISIVLHAIAFIVFFTLYRFISTKIHEQPKDKKETKVCIHLHSLKEEKIPLKSIVPLKKEIMEKKALLKKPKKIKKKVLKKKLKIKKAIKKKVPLKEEKKKEEKKKVPPTQIQKKPITPKKSKKIILPKKPTNNLLAKKRVSPSKRYIEENISKIRELIKENLYYPRRARKRGIEGEVLLRFHLSKDAKISHIEIISSQKEILSRAAIKTIESLSFKFPKPNEEITLKIPLSYTLKR